MFQRSNSQNSSKCLFSYRLIGNIPILLPCNINSGALRDLVSCTQFKKREKHPWRSVTQLLKVTLLHGCFSCFLNCTNGTKSRRAPHIWFLRIMQTSTEVYLEHYQASMMELFSGNDERRNYSSLNSYLKMFADS